MKMDMFYKLVEHEIVPCSMQEFRVRTLAKETQKDVLVSTIFLGIDHSFSGDVPVLFETMVFGGPHDMDQERYTTWQDAMDGHNLMLDRVFGKRRKK